MSGSDERPRGVREDTEDVDVTPGEPVYNDDGECIGHARSIQDGGFFVTTRDGAARLSIGHARSGHDFGQAELMWRCTNCGKMGTIGGGFPDQCPNCRTERENIMYWTED